VTRYLPSRQYLYAGLAALAFGRSQPGTASPRGGRLTVWPGYSWPARARCWLCISPGHRDSRKVPGDRPAAHSVGGYTAVGRDGLDVAAGRTDHSVREPPRAAGLPGRPGFGEQLAAPPAAIGSRGADRRDSLSPVSRRAGRKAAEVRTLASPQYRLLRPEDEAEVELLYQRLKSVRHLDPDSSTDET